MEPNAQIHIEQDGIDLFESTCNRIISEVFGRDTNSTLVTDISDVSDFSVTQEELDNHVALIKEKFGVDMKQKNDWTLLSLCRDIELAKSASVRH